MNRMLGRVCTLVSAAGWLTAGCGGHAAAPRTETAPDEHRFEASEVAAPFERPSDAQVADAVRAVVTEDPRVQIRKPTVTVRDGVVQLGGEVETLAERQYAVAAAERILGVRRIRDEIVLRPSRRDDRDLERDILARVRGATALPAGAIRVNAREASVTLSGECASWWMRDHIGRLAEEVRGVRFLENRIVVKPLADVPDSLLATYIRDSLENDLHLADRTLGVQVNRGEVRLTGDVAHAFERARAGRVAKTVGGVRAVANDIEVRPQLAAIASPSQPPITDATLREEVLSELAIDSRISYERIQVDTRNGEVTLTGTVPYFRQRAFAEDAVRTVVGTKKVTNRLEVRDAGREDAVIVADLRALLDTDYLLADYGISVRVGEGRVRLLGKVPDYVSKLRAGELASYVRGVQAITNDLSVQWESKVNDTVVTRRVQRHLAGNAETSPVARRIRVKVKDGTVTLTGVVHTQAQWEESGRVVFITEGVLAVDNRLLVVPADRVAELERVSDLSQRVREGQQFDPEKEMNRYSSGLRR